MTLLYTLGGGPNRGQPGQPGHASQPADLAGGRCGRADLLTDRFDIGESTIVTSRVAVAAHF